MAGRHSPTAGARKDRRHSTSVKRSNVWLARTAISICLSRSREEEKHFGYIQAANEQGNWAENPVENLPLQGFTYSWFDMYFAMRPGTDIETMEDIGGHTVWPFPTGTSVRQATEHVLKELGLWEDIEVSEVSVPDIPGALEQGRLDVFSSYGVSGQDLAPAVKQIDAQAEVELIPFTEAQKETMRNLDLLSFFESDPYGWEQDVGVDSIAGYSAPSQVAFGEDLSNDVVYEITKIIHENADAVRESAPEAPDLSDPEDLTNAVISGIPVHPGAEEFYREIGAWDDSWESA
jgi:TRAP transporter TAXI family solute receptor